VLVIAGSEEMPGAALLAATASLRAGAGKLAMACPASIAPAVALRMPEARVIGLPQDAYGALRPAFDALGPVLRGATAVLIGPGMQPQQGVTALIAELMSYLEPDAALILDAGGMDVVRGTYSTPAHAWHRVHAPRGGDGSSAGAGQGSGNGRETGVAPVASRGGVKGCGDACGRARQTLLASLGVYAGACYVGIGRRTRRFDCRTRRRWCGSGTGSGLGITLPAVAGQRLALRQGPLGYLATGEVPGLMAAWEDASG